MWKNRIAWLIVVLAALGFYLFENNAGTRVLLAAVVLLPLCSALALYLPRVRLTADFELPETAARDAGSRCVLYLRGSAPARLRASLEIENLLTGERAALSCAVSAGAEGTAFTLRGVHCGCLRVRLASVKAEDALGLFARAIPCAADEGKILIPPRTAPVALSLADTADFLQDSERYSAQTPGCDPGETFRVREYAPGDPVRQIHWKLSEKTDRTMVRDFGLPVLERMLLLLDTAGAAPEDLDLLLDLLFSLSRSLLALDVFHTVGWRDGETGNYMSEEITCPEALDALLTRMLSAPAADGAVAESYLRTHLQCAHAHVAVLTAEPPADIASLWHGNHVTALLPAGRAETAEGGVPVLLWTPEQLRRGELIFEL